MTEPQMEKLDKAALIQYLGRQAWVIFQLEQQIVALQAQLKAATEAKE